LSLLDCEDELLSVVGAVEIANFPKLPAPSSKALTIFLSSKAPSLTPHDEERIHTIRRSSKLLITIGACATSGGHPGLGVISRTSPISSRWCTPSRNNIKTLSKIHPDQRPRLRRFSIARLPHQQTAARRSSKRLPEPQETGDPGAWRVHGVQAARDRLRHVANGTPCLGPVTLAGCGALLPRLRSRLLRVHLDQRKHPIPLR